METMDLLQGQDFFERVNEKLKDIQTDTFWMVAVDIEHFKLFNKIYGRDVGDELLLCISKCVDDLAKNNHGVAGYLGGDNFGLFIPQKEELLEQLNRELTKGTKKLSDTIGFLPVFGICSVDDISLSAMSLYDRAALALSHIVGNYAKRVSYYEKSMSSKIEEEIMLLSEIQKGLENKEFIFYAQPQCDISTGKIVGAESLVRWKHHSKGMISPGVFIPILEKNGLVAELDRYVWDKVCAWIRSWLDKGYQPVPISINVSRIDIFSMDVPQYLLSLIQRYDLKPQMLKVEITESAYAEGNDEIETAVRKLREAGFLVMMDDFGSGYSSLNMLKSVAVDVLKIDMRFLEIDETDMEKGIGILESVVNMSRQMGVPIIVEGVETKAQEDYILGMGCRYTQGFYYYKPMPTEEFEHILTDENNLDFDGLWCKRFEPLHVRELLDGNLFSDTMLNNLLGATAFYDVFENKIELTRVNNQYYDLLGLSFDLQDTDKHKFWINMSQSEQEQLFRLFEKAYANQMNGTCGYMQYTCENGKKLWLYLRVFFLREREGHKLYYSSLTDVTFLREEKHREFQMESKNVELSKKQFQGMEEYYGDMSGAMGVTKVSLDDSGKPSHFDMVYVNKEMEQLCGNVQQLKYLTSKFFELSKADVMDYAYRAAYLGEKVSYEIYSPITFRYFQITAYQFEYGYLTFLVRDITHKHINENTLQCIEVSYQEIYYVHLEDDYYRMIYPDENHFLERGNYHHIVDRWFSTGKILPYDEENIRRFLETENLKVALAEKDFVEYKYKKQTENGDEWYLVSVMVSERTNNKPYTAVMTMRTVDALFKEEEGKRRNNMSDFLAHTGDGFFIYNANGDEKILFANQNVLDIYGCDTMEEFRNLVGNSFKGMVHPDDLERVEREISEQIHGSEKNIDYVEYRIVRRDGEIRWITDCGHLNNVNGDDDIFYVFIYDVTDHMRDNRSMG